MKELDKKELQAVDGGLLALIALGILGAWGLVCLLLDSPAEKAE